MSMKDVARHCSLALMDEGSDKKRWTSDERRNWTAAFNALQRLAGKKTMYRRGKLRSS